MNEHYNLKFERYVWKFVNRRKYNILRRFPSLDITAVAYIMFKNNYLTIPIKYILLYYYMYIIQYTCYKQLAFLESPTKILYDNYH